MSYSTVDAFNIVCRLDRDGKLEEASQDKKQKVATGLLRDDLHKQDFAGPTSSRASKILGPNSRYRVADILPHMRLASRTSRLGLAVGFGASWAMGCARLKDLSVRVMNRGVVLDVRMNPTPSPLQRIASYVRYVHFLLGANYGASTEKPSTP